MSSAATNQKPAPSSSGLRPPSKTIRPASLATPSLPASTTARVAPAIDGRVAEKGPTPSETPSMSLDDSPSLLLRKSSPEPNAVLNEDTDFIIGDRVWVGGNKPGHIQYIGETRFAPGEWAGVVLDEPVGKNDGTVAGVHYFQCEPKRGVFSRLTKLTRYPLAIEGASEGSDDRSATPVRGPSPCHARSNGTVGTGPSSARQTASSAARAIPPRSSTPTSVGSSSGDGKLRVGDRVQVTSASGIKHGVLRYVGHAEFAPGEWAGVELDEPLGKNDGSVDGKRYFTCPMKSGLFAPVHKVSATRRTPTAATTTTVVSQQRRSLVGSGTTPRRSGSHESLGTASSASSISRANKVRLGVTSLTSPIKTPRNSSVTAVATTTALKEALREKEQHIDQLLRERDLERAELAHAAAKVEEAERQLAAAVAESQRYAEEADNDIARYREIAEAAERQRRELLAQLDEERRRGEDLLFRIEEDAISKGDLERDVTTTQSAAEANVERIRDLEAQLDAERKRADGLEHESNKVFQVEEALARSMDEVEVLKTKLRDAETSKLEEGSRAGHLGESLSLKDAEIQALRQRERELVGAVDDGVRTIEQHTSTIRALQSQVSALEKSVESLRSDHDGALLACSDLRQRLQDSEDRCQQMELHKSRLESDFAQMVSSAGDSSSQLVKLNDALRDKERQADDLQKELQSVRQEVRAAQERHEQAKSQSARDAEALGTKHRQEVAAVESKLQESAASSQVRVDELRAEVDAASRETAELRSTLESVDRERVLLLRRVEDGASTRASEADAAASRERELAALVEESTASNSLLQAEVDRLVQERQDQVKAVAERDHRLATLLAEVGRLKSNFDSHRAELLNQLAETQVEAESVRSLRTQLEAQQSAIETLQRHLDESESEKKQLQTIADTSTNVHVVLSERASSLERELEEAKEREAHLNQNFDVEKETLQQMLETTQMLLEQREKDIERRDREISLLKADAAAVDAFRATIGQLERDKTELESRVRELQNSSVAAALGGSGAVDDGRVRKLLEEKEAVEGQVDFLNSVIVDMQRKNDELLARIDVLEIGDVLDDTDVNLNGVKSVVPPRLFCDICDVFDLHDTEDCPKQATEESNSAAHTHYRGTPSQERPYCDACEVFGHWTEDCDDNETF